ncbi:hypothetical protein EON66_01680 [archaeon]|nr:MAG: hypothetical protein EON66_01680 [archaeon]
MGVPTSHREIEMASSSLPASSVGVSPVTVAVRTRPTSSFDAAHFQLSTKVRTRMLPAHRAVARCMYSSGKVCVRSCAWLQNVTVLQELAKTDSHASTGASYPAGSTAGGVTPAAAPSGTALFKHSYEFHHVMHNSSQDEVYDSLAAPAVRAVLDGINSTVMAYGQTGAGKTFTMVRCRAVHNLTARQV